MLKLILHRERQSVPEAKLELEILVAEQSDRYRLFKVGLSREPFRRITNLTAPFQKKNGMSRRQGLLNKTYRWYDPPYLAGILLLLWAPDLDSARSAEQALITHLKAICEDHGVQCMNVANGGEGRRGSPGERFVYLVWA